MTTPTRHMFVCSCFSEGLILEYDPEYKDVNIALWHYGGYSDKLSWKDRIRWCWNILKRGLPWADCVSMQPAEARRLAETILANVKDE